MSNLNYKTRGNSEPKGKPRVYFCCHPNDLKIYFNSVSEEILAEQNCAIWYNSEPEGEYNELFFEDLKQMQLFVMPITSELLNSDNHVLNIELPFAIENHIPVLPLMQEGELEKLFTQKCGDLQFLDKYKHDVTAISYKDKLRKFLDAVLVGDELTDKIRNEFDLHLFLSYRKKDRKYAQELMQLIHKNEMCRDTAIWYDEFLVPGEDFNDAIKDALQKSDVFVLAVTPNLINETNYVMSTEYPMAKRECKPIIPAELVFTDKILLAEKYTEIPRCIDAYNETELSSALKVSFSETTITKNEESPEHKYLIGLAYQNGIDVEIDHARALSLITAAANAEFLDAFEKLVDMYRNGIGVQRSYETSIQWQERLISILQRKFRENPSSEVLNKLFQSICKCADILSDMNMIVAQLEKYQSAIKTLKEALGNTQNSELKRDISSCYIKMCDTYLKLCTGIMEREHINEAISFCLEALKINKELSNEANTSGVQQSMAESYIAMGDVFIDAYWSDNPHKDDLRNAIHSYERALQILDSISEEHSVSEITPEKAHCYEGLAKVYHSMRIFERAIPYYNKVMQIRESLVDENRDIEDAVKLADSYKFVSDLYESKDDLDEAERYIRKSILILEEAHKKTNSHRVYEKLSACYYIKSIIVSKKNDIVSTGLIKDGSFEKTGRVPLSERKHKPRLQRVSTQEIIYLNSCRIVFKLGKRVFDDGYCITNNRAVSNHHADIITQEKQFYVVDRNSVNGTFINGNIITPQCETEIYDGDHITLANEEFIFYV